MIESTAFGPLLGNLASASDMLNEAELFLSPAYRGPRFLLGRNEHSAALLHTAGIDSLIDGIVDDHADGTTWQGKPVLAGENVPTDAMIVNCSMSIAPVSASRRLRALRFKSSLNYADLMAARPDLIPAPAFVTEMRANLVEHTSRWNALYAQLKDEESKTIFTDVLRFRLTADPLYMASYSIRFSDQYFEDFLPLQNAIFVDAGGFNGDTTEEFCKRYPDYREVILFEPSATNMADAKLRLAEHRDIRFIEQGISDAPGTLWFNSDAGSASAVSTEGACRIDVTTLDIALSDAVTFIKMDLEGWEMKALAGAEQHIRNDYPTLAISVYHSTSDFWRIPEYIASIRQDYDIYLRHYTEGWSETVMFFIPKTTAD
ncbi:FkbM family methyltransferase [Herminiimonas arsenitoxidans]|uniref:FkbM family methyltransferase n=1 Tax=Herminiimonas arsenitoxidans TaxID=1809410 RepID=UPI0009707AB2|nr:FkbM family methyltransferase [Herminiimonas arsenitoxidans]